ncbi:VOC family protein [Mesorhizobium calcicola]|uniref:VOC family protein n=1 Tax=Mesorhizobium calcicola TaxID=1300310 RepID=A0ABW4WH77_9HYPH
MNDIDEISLNHFSFTVEDLDRTVSFFEQVFNFEILTKGPRGTAMIRAVTGLDEADIVVAFMKGPGFVIEFIEYVGQLRSRRMDMRPCDASFAHLALNVPDLEQVQKRAEGYGGRPLGKIGTVDTGPNKGKRLMYIQTWDGVTVEIMGEPSP